MPKKLPQGDFTLLPAVPYRQGLEDRVIGGIFDGGGAYHEVR